MLFVQNFMPVLVTEGNKSLRTKTPRGCGRMVLSVVIAFLFSVYVSYASAVRQDTSVKRVADTASMFPIRMLDEVVITGRPGTMPQDEYMRLKYRVRRVWPYALLGAQYFEELDRLRPELSKKQFRKTVKQRQDELYDNFAGILKKFSRKEGRVLIKLIYRQTGISAYDIARDLKSGFRAFWWNTAAGMFSLSLKDVYDPQNITEDYYIEMIIKEGFDNGTLVYAPSHKDHLSYFYTPEDLGVKKAQSPKDRRREKKAARKNDI